MILYKKILLLNNISTVFIKINKNKREFLSHFNLAYITNDNNQQLYIQCNNQIKQILLPLELKIDNSLY